MAASARHAITCLVVILGVAVCISATTTERVASGSISGKVTVKGAPAVKVTVVERSIGERGSPNLRPYRARTDQTGSYRITNLPVGTYEVAAITPALVSANQLDSVVVFEGQELEDVNLSLAPGGVITGRITDADGEPVIGESVTITPAGELNIRGLGQTTSPTAPACGATRKP